MIETSYTSFKSPGLSFPASESARTLRAGWHARSVHAYPKVKESHEEERAPASREAVSSNLFQQPGPPASGLLLLFRSPEPSERNRRTGRDFEARTRFACVRACVRTCNLQVDVHMCGVTHTV